MLYDNLLKHQNRYSNKQTKFTVLKYESKTTSVSPSRIVGLDVVVACFFILNSEHLIPLLTAPLPSNIFNVHQKGFLSY